MKPKPKPASASYPCLLAGNNIDVLLTAHFQNSAMITTVLIESDIPSLNSGRVV